MSAQGPEKAFNEHQQHNDKIAQIEAERDTARMVNETAHQAAIDRKIAERIASEAAAREYYAEATAMDAVIAARQSDAAAKELETESRILHNELAYERHAASNNAFAFYLTLGILAAGIFVSGLFVWWRNQEPNTILAASPQGVSQTVAPTRVVSPPPPIVITPPPAVRTTAPLINRNPPATNPQTYPPAQNPPARIPSMEGNVSSPNGTGGTDNFGADGATPRRGIGTEPAPER